MYTLHLVDNLSLLFYRAPSLFFFFPIVIYLLRSWSFVVLHSIDVAASILMVSFKILTWSLCYVPCQLVVYRFRVLIKLNSYFAQEHFMGVLCTSIKRHITHVSIFFSFSLFLIKAHCCYCLDLLFH